MMHDKSEVATDAERRAKGKSEGVQIESEIRCDAGIAMNAECDAKHQSLDSPMMLSAVA